MREIGGSVWGELVATPRWREALERQAPEPGRCALIGWGIYLQDLAGEPLRVQIKAVNLFVNQVAYRADSEAWGSPVIWAAPRAFFDHDGDCEDYAIAKYIALRALGVPVSKLFVLVAKDEVEGVMHAVLVVDAPDGSLVLDNRSDLIVPWRAFRHHRPIYWVDEEADWISLSS